MCKHFLSSVKLQRSDHGLKSYKGELIDGINNARLMKPKTNKQTNIKCNIIIQAYRSRCSWWKPSSKVRIAKDFSTLLRIQQGEVLREAYYWKRWFPITFCQAAHFSTKNPIDEPAKNNKRILIAAVFHFADAVQKDGLNIRRWHKTLSASATSKQVSRCCINFPHDSSSLALGLFIFAVCLSLLSLSRRSSLGSK